MYIFDSTWNSVSNVYYNCLIRPLALIDKIYAFIGSFKLRLDLTKSNKYVTNCFDGQRFLGINNTNLIICGL